MQYAAHGLQAGAICKEMKRSPDAIRGDYRAIREYFGAATLLEAVLIARREWNLDL